MPGLDESRVISVRQYDDDGTLSLLFQFQLEGMGKPDKFKVTTLAVESLGSTVEEMKIKLCKTAKKLEKRFRRKEQKSDREEGINENTEKETTDEQHVESHSGLLTSLTGPLYRSALYQQFTKWRSHEIGNETETKKNSAQNESEVNERTLRMIKIEVFDTDGCRFRGDTDTVDALLDGRKVIITICDQSYTYEIRRNLPAVRILELPKHMSSGFLVYPRIETNFCDIDDCKFDWFTISTRPSKSNKLSIQQGKVFSGSTLVPRTNRSEDKDTLNADGDIDINSDISECQSINGTHSNTQKENNPIESSVADDSDSTTLSEIETKSLQDSSSSSNTEPQRESANIAAYSNDTGLVATHTKTGNKSNDNGVTGSKTNKNKTVIHWKWVHRGLEFVPGENEVDCFIAVVCTPVSADRIGCSALAEGKNQIWRRQDVYPFENRHAHTKTPAAENGFRVLTYNVLAEKFSDTCESRDFRYAYCPGYALTHDYRKQLILGEILVLNRTTNNRKRYQEKLDKGLTSHLLSFNTYTCDFLIEMPVG